MEIKFLTQPKEVKLGDIIKARLNENYEEVTFIAGMAKDTGFEDLLEDLENAAKFSSQIHLYIGIDRKNTSKDMLIKLLNLGCHLNAHINTDESKVETRIYVFQNKDGTSYIYTSGGKFSSGGLFDSVSTIVELKYDCSHSDDKKSFETAKRAILQGTINVFQSVDQDEIILLAEKGEIVARITERKIPSINEIYGEGQGTSMGEQIYDESTSSSTIRLDELDDITIDFDPEISVRKNVQLRAEKEAQEEQEEKEEILRNLKKNANDLDKFYDNHFSQNEIVKKPTILMSDAPDYKNMTTLMIESNKIPEKGVGAGEFKIPKALSEHLNDFFDNISSTSELTFDIIDNQNSEQTYTDAAVSFVHYEKGISIKSTVMNALKPNEGDIIRLIKEEEYHFRCEIIRKNTAEYDIWERYCSSNIKGTKRKFGII